MYLNILVISMKISEFFKKYDKIIWIDCREVEIFTLWFAIYFYKIKLSYSSTTHVSSHIQGYQL